MQYTLKHAYTESRPVGRSRQHVHTERRNETGSDWEQQILKCSESCDWTKIDQTSRTSVPRVARVFTPKNCLMMRFNSTKQFHGVASLGVSKSAARRNRRVLLRCVASLGVDVPLEASHSRARHESPRVPRTIKPVLDQCLPVCKRRPEVELALVVGGDILKAVIATSVQ